MNNAARNISEVNPVLRLLSQSEKDNSEKDNSASSYRKGWQLAQQLLDQCLQPQRAS